MKSSQETIKKNNNPLIIGNWKMNGSREFITSYLLSLKQLIKCYIDLPATIAILPPVIFISDLFQNLQDLNIAIGAQDISKAQEGAFTGQISGKMLQEFNCQYALVGHSERRLFNGETDSEVAHKLLSAIQFNITPILCIGETKEQYESGQTIATIKKQLLTVLEIAGINALAKTIIAYEPIWAIGTGLAATANQAEEVHIVCRDILHTQSGKLNNCSLIYGGSVTPDNASSFLKKNNIDGLLVGGASLDADKFWQICNNN